MLCTLGIRYLVKATETPSTMICLRLRFKISRRKTKENQTTSANTRAQILFPLAQEATVSRTLCHDANKLVPRRKAKRKTPDNRVWRDPHRNKRPLLFPVIKDSPGNKGEGAVIDRFRSKAVNTSSATHVENVSSRIMSWCSSTVGID